MKNKNGFTLVELMAVVVILIIILLLALNKVRKSSQETKMNAAKANTLSYIKAIDDYAGLDVLVNKELKSGVFSGLDLQNYDIKLSGQVPDSSIFCVNNYKVVSACAEFAPYKIIYENGEITEVTDGQCRATDINCPGRSLADFYDFTGEYKTFTAPWTGSYTIELWGAQGGSGGQNTGAYTKGDIRLNKGDILYIYVGGRGATSCTNGELSGGWNGGSGAGTGGCSYAGGGATDVRLISGNWKSDEGLASRIMVAAGGGGSEGAVAGAGGGIDGTNNNAGNHSTQTSGSAFGYAPTTSGDHSGAGGGYWGGLNPTGDGVPGGGGSSYISGHTGCIGITSATSTAAKSGCIDGTTNRECSIHYSGKYFTNTVIKSGTEEMPNTTGDGTMIGKTGNGYAKISY